MPFAGLPVASFHARLAFTVDKFHLLQCPLFCYMPRANRLMSHGALHSLVQTVVDESSWMVAWSIFFLHLLTPRVPMTLIYSETFGHAQQWMKLMSHPISKHFWRTCRCSTAKNLQSQKRRNKNRMQWQLRYPEKVSRLQLGDLRNHC